MQNLHSLIGKPLWMRNLEAEFATDRELQAVLDATEVENRVIRMVMTRQRRAVATEKPFSELP
jgi:hypothetical protein